MGKSNTFLSSNSRNKFSGVFLLLLSILLFINSSAVAQNNPPVITWCPISIEDSHCNTFVFDFDAYDPDGDSLTFHIASGPGSIDPFTGLWWWNWATLADVGFPIVLEVSVSDGVDVVTCETNVIATNTTPNLYCPSTPVTLQTGDTKTQTVGATDDCDPLTYSIINIGGATGNASIDGNGVLTYSPAFDDGALVQPVRMTVSVTDGNKTAYCRVYWNVVTEATYRISLGELDNNSFGVNTNTVYATPGKTNEMFVGIDKVNVDAGFGGFDLRVVYDASVLSFYGAEHGNIYDDCGWEYFTYRFVYDGEILLIGIAELNDGPNHPGCATPTPYVNELPTTLASIKFLAADSSVLSGYCVPVRFYWRDCGDNILSDSFGDALLAANVYNAGDPNQINNPEANVPTLLGLPSVCGNPYGGTRQVDFQNGQFCFPPDCHSGHGSNRGDINDNCFPNEVADVEMFKNYFLHDFAAFEDHVSWSIAATDVNADGEVLTISDLIYLIRVVIGEDTAIVVGPNIVPTVKANFSFENGVMSISNEIFLGGTHIVVAGNVEPTLQIEGIAINYAYDIIKDVTNIVVTIPLNVGEEVEGFTGDFLKVIGELAKPPMFSTVEGFIVEQNLIPKTFKLSQNYPNPFNPTTVIATSISERVDYKLTIVNSLGQVVEVISGIADPGILEIKWDATGLASGVYFYKMEAGGFTATKKAVLLK